MPRKSIGKLTAALWLGVQLSLPGAVAAGARAYLGLPAEPRFPAAGRWAVDVAFPNLTFKNPIFLEPEPGTRRLLVGELEGRIYAIDGTNTATDEKRMVLDLSAHTQGGWDCGLLNLVFHPQYDRRDSANRGFIYVWYSWTPERVTQGRPPPDMVTWTRLSRFRVDPLTGVADPKSELVLMDQRDRYIIHAGGGLFFHPKDGFLYISVGDEGIVASADNTQRIDRNLFSGVLRIDVDRRGGEISHPIRQQPRDGKTDHYYIPNDNPFVGQADALEEFFAVGLRNPHRMTYDPVDDLAWIGDIGQSAVEEVSVLEFGRPPQNFQWDIREGNRAGPGADLRTAVPGTWTEPVFTYERDQGKSIIGGYVYRGEKFPELRGKYLCGDFTSGRVWALTYARTPRPKVVAAEVLARTSGTNYNYRGGEGGITSFGRDHAGELYLLQHGLYSAIKRLRPGNAGESNIPPLLSQTGVFSDVKRQIAAPGLRAYEVNLPQWTDGLPARRWISLPGNSRAQFAPHGPWRFPAGTVFVQHFDLPADAGLGRSRQPLETRVLVVGENGAGYAVAYKWRPDGSDAEFVAEDDSRPLGPTDTPGERWAHLSPQKCVECHNGSAGYVLGVNTRQLNRAAGEGASHAVANQLAAWSKAGALDAALPDDATAALPRLASGSDTGASLEQRVRSYLDVYCSHCHGRSPVRAAWDGSLETPLAKQNLLFGPLIGESVGPGYFVVSPRDATGSVLLQRAASRDLSWRMPPLGQSAADESFLHTLRTWIETLPRDEHDAPALVRARKTGPNAISLVFSEAVRAGAGEGGAERTGNYQLTPATEIRAARLQPDLRTVILTTAELKPEVSYVVAVSSVVDLARVPNAVPQGTSTPVR